jgi:hypothetical protein
MGTAIDGIAIDKWTPGAVPHVAAIAASRDGVIYGETPRLRALAGRPQSGI